MTGHSLRGSGPTTHPCTWGLDVSTKPQKTAAVRLEWRPGEAHVVDIRTGLTALDIIELITEYGSEPWAVDVPFGWPDRFVDLMDQRHKEPLPAERLPVQTDWDTWRKQQVAQRQTDRYLTDHLKVKPLPASFDRLGATAAMWVLCESRLVSAGVKIDRSGVSSSTCETYPRAALAAWLHTEKGKITAEQLSAHFPFLRISSRFEEHCTSNDVCDAIVCGLVARARALGLTVLPERRDLEAARREGWIHVSLAEPSALLP